MTMQLRVNTIDLPALSALSPSDTPNPVSNSYNVTYGPHRLRDI